MSDAQVQTDDFLAVKQKQLHAAKRMLCIREARTSLRAFMRLMLPDEEDPDDPDKSKYQDTAHGALLCEILEDVEAGKRKRVAVSIPPQHGKTWHLSNYGPAWILGRDPKAQIIIAAYNQTRGEELGEMFRAIVTSDQYRAIFPGVTLEIGSKSKSSMTTTKGGKIRFVGTGGTITGRTAEYFFVDDPIKDDEDIQSDTYRDKLWKWFFSVAYSRGSKKTRICVVHTRWHADDLIGRLCDPNHVDRKDDDGLSKDWLYLNLSGVVEDPELAKALNLELKVPTDPKVIRAFGQKPMCALWESEKPLEFYAPWAIAEPRTFSALVRGSPTVEDGEYFRAETLVEYDAHELPSDLRYYGASDHAVTAKQHRDANVLGCVGIDADDNIWVLPDIVWERMETDRVVEELLLQFKAHKPELWWLEDELISKSFGPFLRKRMVETRIYTSLDPIVPSKEMRLRARAIQGRMNMRKVRFPRFAHWWPKAKSELLQFDHGVHDDFVSFMALVGLGLMKERRAAPKIGRSDLCVVGSPQWIMRQSMQRGVAEKRQAAVKGW